MKPFTRILVFSLLLSFIIAFGQRNVDMIQFKNTDSVFQIKGLSQVVEVPLGASRMLILSGQVPVNQKRRSCRKRYQNSKPAGISEYPICFRVLWSKFQ